MRTLICLFLFCCWMQRVSAQCNPAITTVGNTTFCQGGSVTLVGSFGDTYQWLLNGSPITGATDDSLVVTTQGSYTVEIDSVGCINTSPAQVITVNTVPPQPASISGDTEICVETVHTYSVVAVPGATSYIWSGGSPGFSDTTTTPSNTGLIKQLTSSSPLAQVAVAANNSCGSSAPTSLSINTYAPVTGSGFNNYPDISDMGASICHQGGTRMMPLSMFKHKLYGHWHYTYGFLGGISYQWYKNGLVLPGETGQYLEITRGGNYEIEVTNGGCVSKIPKLVYHMFHILLLGPTIQSRDARIQE